MVKLLQSLYRTRLLSPAGLFYLIQAVLTTGINLMGLLRIAAKLHPHRTAVIDDRHALTYPQLWQQAEGLALAL
jgi:fatty-acyl-CoA synthase